MAVWVRTLTLAWLLAAGTLHAQGAAQRYEIDAAQSEIHWLVYKAGALARLGHNHTIAVGDLTGSVTVDTERLAESRFVLEFSAARLVIDDSALRATLGEDFASVPSADDVAGTHKNMLSDRVLDGERFPKIRVAGVGPVGPVGSQTLALTIELLGRSIELSVPTHVEIGADRLLATGEFELNHADLGMQPFSVMMGALQVGEKLSFAYRVTARRVGP